MDYPLILALVTVRFAVVIISDMAFMVGALCDS
jgi:hypothetical protein